MALADHKDAYLCDLVGNWYLRIISDAKKIRHPKFNGKPPLLAVNQATNNSTQQGWIAHLQW